MRVVLLIASLLGVCTGFGRPAVGAMTVAIPSGCGDSFREDSRCNGEVEWATSNSITVPAGAKLLFEASLSLADPDNVPESPAFSDLTLRWADREGDSIAWDFVWVSSRIGGPRDTWIWSALMDVEDEFVLLEDAAIATCSWSTGGDDVDDVADEAFFTMIASGSIVVEVSDEWLTIDSAVGQIALNPEPVPEPSTVLLCCTLGLLPLFRNRRGQ